MCIITEKVLVVLCPDGPEIVKYYIFVNSEKMSCVLNEKIIILYSKYGKTRNFMSFKCLSIT